MDCITFSFMSVVWLFLAFPVCLFVRFLAIFVFSPVNLAVRMQTDRLARHVQSVLH